MMGGARVSTVILWRADSSGMTSASIGGCTVRISRTMPRDSCAM